MSETLQDFELAREERLWDGTSLWNGTPPRVQGGIYLLGYHAEMSLKVAYFRWQGVTIATAIDRPRLNTARGRATVLGVTTPDESFHSLRFWRDLLVAERATAGTPLDPPLAAGLHANVETIYARWGVEMRYRTPRESLIDLEVTAAAADWIDRNLTRLYT